MSLPVVILGGGGHAQVIWDVLECLGHRVVGFTAPNIPPGTLRRLGGSERPVLGDDGVLEQHIRRDPDLRLFAGVGPEPAKVRRAVVEKVSEFGPGRMLVASHPRSVVALSAVLGLDTIVMAGAVVNPDVVVGRHCVVNTGSTIDHDCELGDNVFVGPGAHLGGATLVGEGSVIGIGASVKDGVRIGRHVYVGGGAFVNRDVPDAVVVVGVPARVLRVREIG